MTTQVAEKYYTIECHQNAPLSSWDEIYTATQLLEKFWDYALDDWEEQDIQSFNPTNGKFTLDLIEELWEVSFHEITDPTDLALIDKAKTELGGLEEYSLEDLREMYP